MATDVKLIADRPNGGVPLAAARLCNFSTGGASPLPAHRDWISGPLASALRNANSPFVDIFAFASKSGSADSNLALSQRRLDAVHDLVMQAVPNCGLVDRRDKAYGETVSGGGEYDNSGEWRAVEVHAYAALPPGRTPAPPKPRPAPIPAPTPAPAPSIFPWWVTNFNVTEFSLVDLFGVGGSAGTISFTSSLGQTVQPNIAIAGVSAGLGDGVQLSAMLMKRVLSNPLVLKALGKAAGWVSWGSQLIPNLPTPAYGPVVPGDFNLTLSPADFTGGCLVIFIDGSICPFTNCGVYMAFMGLNVTPATLLASFAGPVGLALSLICMSRSIAIFGAGSLQIGIDLGGKVNVWPGYIW